MRLDYTIIGVRIREIRNKRNLSQAELAELSEVEPTTISHIERATTKVSLPTLLSIANALETTLDELVYTNLVKSQSVSLGMIDALLQDCSADELKSIAEMIKTTKTILRIPK